MNFVDFIAPQAIKVGLEALDKPGIIREMVDLLVASGGVAKDERDSVIEAIIKREEHGSTGIGRGVAIPHTKHPGMQKLVGAVATSEHGIDFDSLDGGKVRLLFMLVSPVENQDAHVAALQRIAGKLREDIFCRFLLQADAPENIWQALEDADEEGDG